MKCRIYWTKNLTITIYVALKLTWTTSRVSIRPWLLCSKHSLAYVMGIPTPTLFSSIGVSKWHGFRHTHDIQSVRKWFASWKGMGDPKPTMYGMQGFLSEGQVCSHPRCTVHKVPCSLPRCTKHKVPCSHQWRMARYSTTLLFIYFFLFIDKTCQFLFVLKMCDDPQSTKSWSFIQVARKLSKLCLWTCSWNWKYGWFLTHN